MTLALALGFSLSLFAQSDQTQQSEVVIVQKTTSEDGTETIIKKRVYSGDDAKSYLQEHNNELSSMWEGNEEQGAEHYMIIRRDQDGRKKEVVIQMDGMDDRHEWEQLHEEVKVMHQSKENKAFMGVYPEGNPLGEGVLLDGIVNHSGAQKAGLHTGDVMVSINDFQLVRQSDLSQALAQHKPGETITVTYLREGQTMQTQVLLTARNSYAQMERDPCQVFIGVSLGRQHAVNGQGVAVSHVIANTSAERHGVADGDVIIRLDDVAVSSYQELLIERNKHQAGDWFTLTVLRNGTEIDIDAQFMSCDEQKEEPLIELIEEPVLEEVAEEVPEVREPATFDTNLQLVDFKAFPNPTYDRIQVQFQAEAKPSLIRISDITGKVVYEESLQQFDGYYNQEVNLEGIAAPGTLILTITQEGRVLSDKIVLLPKA